MILTDQAEAMGVKNTNDLTDNMKENKKGKMMRQPAPVSSLNPVMQQTLLSLVKSLGKYKKLPVQF